MTTAAGGRPVAAAVLAALALLSSAGAAVAGASSAAGSSSPAATDWRTPSEKTGLTETPRLAETAAYLKRIEAATLWIRVASFGRSGEGRDLILVIASKDRAFDPAAAARTGKPVVLLQAGIHAGEIDGKDAGLALLRDMAVTREKAALLDRVILLFMPIYNVDGHERFSAWNRINQNGPKEMGWRVTAKNLNLNRDYMKADAVETRAWLEVFNAWRPDFVIDAHVTDGADFRYDVTYGMETGPNVPAPIVAWEKEAIEGRAIPAIAAAGHLVAPYIFLRDDTDPSLGLGGATMPPRFSTSYTVLRNRPSFLIETHMLKDYPTRVRATYDTVVALIEAIGRDPGALRAAVRRADEEAARPGTTPLQFKASAEGRTVEFKGVQYRREPSAISGAMRIIYGAEPLDLQVPRYDHIETTLSVERPIAYLVPPQWTEVIDVLRAHGLELKRLAAPLTAPVAGYRLSEPKWQETPFEGRHPVTFKSESLPAGSRTFPAGTVVVPLQQRDSALAMNLLDPQGPDSFAAWGFFDAIFEQKEYAEPYVMERLAREMLDHDPALKIEFEKALADPDFAASPRKRLDFFFRRSPWWDASVGLYPVGLLTSPDLRMETRPDAGSRGIR
jgi:hypothetical protein